MRADRPSHRFMGFMLRAVYVSVGLAIALSGAFALRDGDATLGIPGRNTQSAAVLVHLDAWPELLVTAAILAAFSALFVLAGISPRWFTRTPAVPLLVALAFLLLVAVPFLTSGK